MKTAADVEVGQVLRRIRFVFTDRRRRIVSQGEFGSILGEALGERPYRQSTVSEWEKGETPVPARVLLAALRLVSGLLGRPVTFEEALTGIKLSYLSAAA